MAKKEVGAEHEAYKSKGMKAPRPGSMAKPSQSDAPSQKGPHQEKKDPHDADMGMKPHDKQQSDAPKHKGSAQSAAEAASPFTGVNGGEKMELPKGGSVGESDV